MSFDGYKLIIPRIVTINYCSVEITESISLLKINNKQHFYTDHNEYLLEYRE